METKSVAFDLNRDEYIIKFTVMGLEYQLIVPSNMIPPRGNPVEDKSPVITDEMFHRILGQMVTTYRSGFTDGLKHGK